MGIQRQSIHSLFLQKKILPSKNLWQSLPSQGSWQSGYAAPKAMGETWARSLKHFLFQDTFWKILIPYACFRLSRAEDVKFKSLS